MWVSLLTAPHFLSQQVTCHSLPLLPPPGHFLSFPPSFQGARSGLVWQCLFQEEEKGLKACVCSLESWSLQLLIWPLDYGTFVQQRQLCLQEPLQSCNTKVRAAVCSPRSAFLSPQSRPLYPLYLISWLYLARRSERHGAPVLI